MALLSILATLARLWHIAHDRTGRSGDPEIPLMQYALLIYENDAEAYPGGEADAAWRDIVSAHEAFSEELIQAGAMRGGAGLKPTTTATTIRVDPAGRTVHDGPFAETREQLGGFYLIEAANLDDAIAWARKLPLTGHGAVEIRPVLEETA